MKRNEYSDKCFAVGEVMKVKPAILVPYTLKAKHG